MSFEARYDGRCAYENCSSAIEPGDEIEYAEDELMHTSCATQHRRSDPPLCGNCYTHHRGDCL